MIKAIEDREIELQEKHIVNLKIILNREKLLTLLPKKAVVAELGVDKGEFSHKILSIAKPKKMYLIDTWDSQRYNEDKLYDIEKKFKKDIINKKVVIQRGISLEVLKKFSDGFFDWVYIDTTHTFDQTYSELQLCKKKVKLGGLITGHDYTQGNIRNGKKFGVVQAVNLFCIKYNWEFIYLTHECYRHLSFAIREIL